VKFGIHGLHRGEGADPGALSRRARLAEATGFESIWVGDHVALPVAAEGSANPALEPRLEVLSTLAFLAAATTTVRLAAGVIVLPQRQPVLLAKQLTTIDVLSAGRLIVGVGVGYVEAELAALGIGMDERAARTDEYLAALEALWSEPAADFEGRFASFSGVAQRPLPVQRPHPPIVVGGHSAAALRRAARSASGWYGWNLDPDETARLLSALREALETEGRDDGIEISVTPSGAVDVDAVRRYAEVGVHRLVLAPETTEGADVEELIATVGETLVGRV
jgi:probable F420-dependent oxidoreductase